MSGITGTCFRLMGELVHALGGCDIQPASSSSHTHMDTSINPTAYKSQARGDDLMLRALTVVFGMDQSNCRINKKKARQVVEKLGLVDQDEQLTSSFDLSASGGWLEEEVPLEEVLLTEEEEEDGSKRNELLRQAFKIFDEDGNGFIDALELKKVLQCLGLDNGWDLAQIQKMLKVVDLNLDGKVDFNEFELMMNEAALGLN